MNESTTCIATASSSTAASVSATSCSLGAYICSSVGWAEGAHRHAGARDDEDTASGTRDSGCAAAAGESATCTARSSQRYPHLTHTRARGRVPALAALLDTALRQRHSGTSGEIRLPRVALLRGTLRGEPCIVANSAFVSLTGAWRVACALSGRALSLPVCGGLHALKTAGLAAARRAAACARLRAHARARGS
jgi:hypothetical protein